MADKTPNEPGKKATSTLKEKRSAKKARQTTAESRIGRDRA